MKEILYLIVYITLQTTPSGGEDRQVRYFELQEKDSVEYYIRAYKQAKEIQGLQKGFADRTGEPYLEERIDTCYVMEYIKK